MPSPSRIASRYSVRAGALEAQPARRVGLGDTPRNQSERWLMPKTDKPVPYTSMIASLSWRITVGGRAPGPPEKL